MPALVQLCVFDWVQKSHTKPGTRTLLMLAFAIAHADGIARRDPAASMAAAA